MVRLVKLHGTCGSGKTTIARKFMEEADDVAPLYGEHKKRPEAYQLDMGWNEPLIILGPYENVCGGLDALDSDTCVHLVDKYGSMGVNVFYESMIASGFYGRMGKVSEKWGPDHIFAFLTTSIDECIARTIRRRAERGVTKTLDPVNIIGKDLAMQRLKQKLVRELKRTVVDVTSYEDVRALYDNK
jgi:hypothetical protein